MRSSTSSSDGAIPAGPWGRSFALALALAAAVLVALEGFWRSRGHVPSITDDLDLWCLHRERAHGAGRETIVVLGMSRIQLDFVPATFREECPGYRIVNLSVAGAAPMATLRDLAEDDSFAGIVLCSAIVADLLPEVADAQLDYTRYYHREWNLNKKLGRMLRTVIQQNTVVTLPNLALHRVGRRTVQRGALPPPLYYVTHADRFRQADYTQAWFQRRRAPASQGAQPAPRRRRRPGRRWKTFDELSATPQQWRARVRQIDALVQQIQDRGGTVVFLRPVSSGPRRALEERLFPRAQFWDVLAERTHATTIHYEDVAAMGKLTCPDGVHLHFTDAFVFTRHLARELRRRGVVGVARPDRRRRRSDSAIGWR